MAGRTGVTVKIISNNLPHLSGFMRRAAIAEVKRASYSVEAHGKAGAPVKTGALRRSIHSVFENGGLTGLIGPSVDYGKFVEFGTRRMGPRPFMRPAAEAVLPTFAARLKTVIESLARGGAVPDLPSFPAATPLTSIPRKPKRAGAKKAVKVKKVAKQKRFESSGFREARRRNAEYERLGRAAERAARKRRKRS